jgi:hypothetical protein
VNEGSLTEDLKVLEENMNANISNFRNAQRMIEHRMQWEQISRVDRLERALKAARGKLTFLPNLSARTN